MRGSPGRGSHLLFILGLCVIGLVLVLQVSSPSPAQLARMRALGTRPTPPPLDATGQHYRTSACSGVGDAVPLMVHHGGGTATPIASRPLPGGWKLVHRPGDPERPIGRHRSSSSAGTADLPVVTPLLGRSASSITITVESRAHAPTSNPAPRPRPAIPAGYLHYLLDGRRLDPAGWYFQLLRPGLQFCHPGVSRLHPRGDPLSRRRLDTLRVPRTLLPPTSIRGRASDRRPGRALRPPRR